METSNFYQLKNTDKRGVVVWISISWTFSYQTTDVQPYKAIIHEGLCEEDKFNSSISTYALKECDNLTQFNT